MSGNIYQPHIAINGQRLAETVDAAGTRAIAAITIDWGVNDWYSEYDPANATVVVRNAQPNYAQQAANNNYRILITRDPDETVVFRGRIVQGHSTIVRETNRHGRTMQFFEHTLKAEDVLGDLRRDRRRGPIYASREGEDQVAHWGPCTMRERKADIDSRCPVPIEWHTTQIDEFDEPATGWRYIWPVTPYERQSTVSLLTVLRNTTRIAHAFRRPVYLHSQNRIVLMRPSSGRGLRAERTESIDPVIDIFSAQLVEDNNIAEVLPAAAFTADEFGISSTEVEQVTRLELQIKACRYNQLVTSNEIDSGSRQVLEWVDANETIDVIPKAGSQLTVSFDSDHSGGYTYPENFWHQGLAASETIQGLYGQPKLHPMTYQFSKTDEAPEWALPLLIPEPPTTELLNDPKPFMLKNSVLNAWPKQPGFAILGGTITYTHKQGWRAEVNPVPCLNWGHDAEPTLGDLQTADLADGWLALIEDGSTVGDWQQITSIQ